VDAVAIDGHVVDGDAVGLEPDAGGQHGLVLDGGGEDPVGRLGGALDGAAQDLVGGLGAAGGEDDLAGLGAEQVGDALAGPFDGAAGALAPPVNAGGVAEVLAQEGEHLVEHFGVDGGGGVVVEVDAVHAPGRTT
jgi:hypothetical protein